MVRFIKRWCQITIIIIKIAVYCFMGRWCFAQQCNSPDPQPRTKSCNRFKQIASTKLVARATAGRWSRSFGCEINLWNASILETHTTLLSASGKSYLLIGHLYKQNRDFSQEISVKSLPNWQRYQCLRMIPQRPIPSWTIQTPVSGCQANKIKRRAAHISPLGLLFANYGLVVLSAWLLMIRAITETANWRVMNSVRQKCADLPMKVSIVFTMFLMHRSCLQSRTPKLSR